jgi:hypothetical protein
LAAGQNGVENPTNPVIRITRSNDSVAYIWSTASSAQSPGVLTIPVSYYHIEQNQGPAMAKSSRPNFLLFITDQHRADFLSATATLCCTRIDCLAESPTSLCGSPVCQPNRASLMTDACRRRRAR